MTEQHQEQAPEQAPKQITFSFDEMLESLTGFEEIGIEEAFGADITALMLTNVTKAQRALVFVVKKREGLKATDARKAVLEMRLGDVQAFFADDEPEVNEDEPVTAAGKDDEQPG